MTWTAADAAKLRADRIADGRCVYCGGKLLPEWGEFRGCPDCREQIAARRDTPEARAKHNRHSAAYQKRVYWRDPAAARKARNDRNLDRKIEGKCIACKEPCADDSIYCPPHRDAHRASSRAGMARKRARDRARRFWLLVVIILEARRCLS